MEKLNSTTGEHWCRVDPRHAVFGKLMWEMIQKMGGDFCGDEWSEDVLPLAERAGLCSRATYDPEKHGDGIEAEPGDEIWWLGDSIPNVSRQRPLPAETDSHQQNQASSG
jgi:hypothetical protein